MDLVNAVAVVIAGVFAPAVYRPMVETPLWQAAVNVVFIGIYPGSRRDEPLDQRRIVTCRTFSSIWITTAPPVGSSRKSAAFRCPGRRARVPPSAGAADPAAFFHRVRMPLATGHDVDFVALHFPDQDRFGLAGDDPVHQLLGHALNVIRVPPQLLGNLGIRGSSP